MRFNLNFAINIKQFQMFQAILMGKSFMHGLMQSFISIPFKVEFSRKNL